MANMLYMGLQKYKTMQATVVVEV